MNKYNEQLQRCLRDGTCVVIDRGLANCALSGELCDRDRCLRNPKNMVEMSSESKELLRERWGDIVDCIGIRKARYDDEYEMSAMFYKRFKTSILDEKMYERATMSAAYELCNIIEKTVMNRAPNTKTPHNRCIADIEFNVCNNVPDGVVFVSPRTYYEMVGEILND